MNNLYLQERMVDLKMQEIQREVDQARLLKEAGLSDPNLLVRAAQSLRSLWRGRKRLPDLPSVAHHAYQSDKAAP
jgi:hypothetical protein